jgi:FMN phosphatase YigB (HAD superfamily)
LIFLLKTNWNILHTKNIDSQLCIDWREESINKMNEPPGEVECYRYWEENYTGSVPEKKGQQNSISACMKKKFWYKIVAK